LERRFAAILGADVVGYTRLKETDEAEALTLPEEKLFVWMTDFYSFFGFC
jgi:hypothetical protein